MRRVSSTPIATATGNTTTSLQDEREVLWQCLLQDIRVTRDEVTHYTAQLAAIQGQEATEDSRFPSKQPMLESLLNHAKSVLEYLESRKPLFDPSSSQVKKK